MQWIDELLSWNTTLLLYCTYVRAYRFFRVTGPNRVLFFFRTYSRVKSAHTQNFQITLEFEFSVSFQPDFTVLFALKFSTREGHVKVVIDLKTTLIFKKSLEKQAAVKFTSRKYSSY